MPSLLRANSSYPFLHLCMWLEEFFSSRAITASRDISGHPWVFGCQESETEAPSYFDGKYEHRAMFTGISGVTLEARETKTAFAGS